MISPLAAAFRCRAAARAEPQAAARSGLRGREGSPARGRGGKVLAGGSRQSGPADRNPALVGGGGRARCIAPELPPGSRWWCAPRWRGCPQEPWDSGELEGLDRGHLRRHRGQGQGAVPAAAPGADRRGAWAGNGDAAGPHRSGAGRNAALRPALPPAAAPAKTCPAKALMGKVAWSIFLTKFRRICATSGRSRWPSAMAGYRSPPWCWCWPESAGSRNLAARTRPSRPKNPQRNIWPSPKRRTSRAGSSRAGPGGTGRPGTAEIRATAPEGYKTLANLRAAGLYAAAGKTDQADALWTRIGPARRRRQVAARPRQPALGAARAGRGPGYRHPGPAAADRRGAPTRITAWRVKSRRWPICTRAMPGMAKSFFAEVHADPSVPEGVREHAQAMLAS